MSPLPLARLLASAGLFISLLVATIDAYRPPTEDPHESRPVAMDVASSRDLVGRGQAVFQAKGCVACHTIAGIPGRAPVGPDLTALPLVANSRRPGMNAEDYVRESLVSPQAYVVPGYSGSGTNPGSPPMPKLALSPAEIEALIAFLLSANGPAAAFLIPGTTR